MGKQVSISLIVGVAVLVGLVSWQTATGQSVANEVKARRFVLVNQHGKHAITMRADNNGSGAIIIRDMAERERVKIYFDPRGNPLLDFLDERRQTLLTINLTQSTPMIAKMTHRPGATDVKNVVWGP